MRRLIPIAIGVLLLVAAALVHAASPVAEVRLGPFQVVVGQGEKGVGRNVEATFENVRFAESVEVTDSFSPWVGETEGMWLVVDMVVATRLEPSGIHGFLLVDGLKIPGSTRPGVSVLEDGVQAPGLPEVGVMLFEVPPYVTDLTEARLFVTSQSDWRLDSAIVLPFNPSSVEVESHIRFAEPERVPS